MNKIIKKKMSAEDLRNFANAIITNSLYEQLCRIRNASKLKKSTITSMVEDLMPSVLAESNFDDIDRLDFKHNKKAVIKAVVIFLIEVL